MNFEDFLDINVVDELIRYKKMTYVEIANDIHNVVVTSNRRAGSKTQYHFFMEQFLHVETDSEGSFISAFEDARNGDLQKLSKLIYVAETYGHTKSLHVAMFEAWRLNGGPVLFPATMARDILLDNEITMVFDPCAGWGGRMLGAFAAGIDYIAVDTNYELQNGYAELADLLTASSPGWYGSVDSLSCLDINWPDMPVFTCPPYLNAERYTGQPKHDMDFLAPFVDKMQGHDVYLVVDSVTLDSIERLAGPAIRKTGITKAKSQHSQSSEYLAVWKG